ncbi:MAG: PQQ-binding-like beta-propeller repeat protein, partial [Phycisphaerales bacterium]
WIKAGQRLYASKGNTIMAIDLPNHRVSWQAEVAGNVGGAIAADDKLFVSTQDGRIYCFAARGPAKRWAAPQPAQLPSDRWRTTAGQVLDATGVTEGYCLVLGLSDGQFAQALVRSSKLCVIGVDADERKVDAIRARLDAAGLYGSRIVLRKGHPLTFPFPPYLASLIVSEDLSPAGLGQPDFVEKLFHPLRPYGGVACLELPAAERRAFGSQVRAAGLLGAEVKLTRGYSLLRRAGAPPGSADVTHEGVDAANTFCSKDQLVRLPLGVLWFGGPTGRDVFLGRLSSSRPQVVGGKMITEGPEGILATDIYTGRRLWEFRTPRRYPPTRVPGADLGEDAPGPRFRIARVQGTGYVSASDCIYVRNGRECLRLNPETGEKMSVLTLPDNASWGSLAVWDDLLIAGADPVALPKGQDRSLWSAWHAGASRKLMVLNRHNGNVLWAREASDAFRHTAIAVGGGRIFCIDRLPQTFAGDAQRRGKAPDGKPRLIACDVRSGKEIWSLSEDVVGTWMSYSEEHDILIQGPDWGKDQLSAHRGKDGGLLWRKQIGAYTPVAFIHYDQLIVHRSIRSLRTGESIVAFDRSYGCNLPSVCENLILFRSNSAGYYDLARYGGTGNFSGFRSACANSLVAAGGVLSAPNMSHGCVCNFPIQTSLALVHTPGLEYWTWGGTRMNRNRIGINLGAPGDRASEEGTLWTRFPVPRGATPDIGIKTEPAAPKWFRYDSSSVHGEGLRWVGSSGARGLRSLVITLDREGGGSSSYDVRLYFADPDPIKPGDRLLDISIQGRQVARQLDIVKEGGGARRMVVRTINGVKIGDTLTVDLVAAKGSRVQETVICGIEVIGEAVRE